MIGKRFVCVEMRHLDHGQQRHQDKTQNSRGPQSA
jgi:hypothetical protein